MNATGEYVAINALQFNQKSSIRFKKEVEDLTEEEAKQILKIRPVSFKYINQNEDKIRYGVIAEETVDVIPSVVTYDEDGEPDGVAYADFIPYLIKMIQMQQKQINSLLQK